MDWNVVPVRLLRLSDEPVYTLRVASHPYIWVNHLCNDWVQVFVLHDFCDFPDEGVGVINLRLGFGQQLIKYDGNEHFSPTFLDKGCTAILHLVLWKFITLWVRVTSDMSFFIVVQFYARKMSRQHSICC